MKKIPALFIFLVLLLGIAPVFAGGSPGLLQKTTADDYSFKSFDEAVKIIGQKTGCKVVCPSEITDFMRSLGNQGDSISLQNKAAPAQISLKLFLDSICSMLNLCWTLDADQRTITLGFPWKDRDTRSTRQLLDFAWKHKFTPDLFKHNPEWETAFRALLSSGRNMEKAWKTRMLADRSQMDIFIDGVPARGETLDEPVLRERIVSTTGKKYILFLLFHMESVFPSVTSANYYWFKEDGTLAGSGAMELGGFYFISDAKIVNAPYSEFKDASELRLNLSVNTESNACTFVLEADGLKLKQLNGSSVKTGNYSGIGKPLF